MTYDAFISYRRSDRITADGIARFLDAFGLKVFVDRSSRAGTHWEQELREALASAKVLVVLWSRSAAQSDWVEQEWSNVSAACRVVPLKLDGEPLPAELSRLTAVEGLDVGSRLLQRSFELMQQERLSPGQAQEQLVQELAADGVVLEPKKRDALGIFLGFVSGVTAAVALSHVAQVERPSAKDSVPASSSTTPPTSVGGGRWASLLGAAGVSGAAAFGLGLWAAPGAGAAASTLCAETTVPASGPPAPSAATSCPPAPVCSVSPVASSAPPARVPPANCPCSREQCERTAAPTPTSRELTKLQAELQNCKKEHEALEQKFNATTRALIACTSSRQPSPPPTATLLRPTTGPAPTAFSPGLAASAPAPAPTLQ